MSPAKPLSDPNRLLLLLVLLLGATVLGASSEPQWVEKRVYPRDVTRIELVTEVVGYQPIPVTCSMHPCNVPDQTRVSWVVKNIINTKVVVIDRDSCIGFCRPQCGALQPECNRCAYC